MLVEPRPATGTLVRRAQGACGGVECSKGRRVTEYHDRQTMERLRERLAHADSELEAAQHFLAPRSAEEAEMDIVLAVANARAAVGDALDTVRSRLGEADRG
jgi:anti-sigma factor ChrR (cupin superfamily)